MRIKITASEGHFIVEVEETTLRVRTVTSKDDLKTYLIHQGCAINQIEPALKWLNDPGNKDHTATIFV
jgi:hypothetical protein